MARKKKTIGRAESKILAYVAEHPDSTVREVAENFGRTEGQARTTVLTVMERLRKKGYLTRRSVEGIYRYAPAAPKRELLRGLVRDFVEESLGGSLMPFMAYLADSADLSDEELADLRMLVQSLELRKKRGGT